MNNNTINKSNIKVISDEIDIRYTFIPSPIDINQIEKTAIIQSNDVFAKFAVKANVTGELIVCSDLNALSKFNKKIVKETFEEYLEIKATRDQKKDQWIHNIIDGISEQQDIILRDPDFILIPSYTWDKKNLEQLHVLAILTDKSLSTIRDLTAEHIPILQKIIDVGLETIEWTWPVERDSIKMFIHYTPSAFQLHVHFANTNNNSIDSSVEYSHELSQVMFNLGIKSDYYKELVMCKRV